MGFWDVDWGWSGLRDSPFSRIGARGKTPLSTGMELDFEVGERGRPGVIVGV